MNLSPFILEYRFPNDVGVIDANIFYHDHHDVIERIDVTRSEENLESANGNIGDGRMYGININTSLRLRWWNLPNVLVTSRYNLQDSEVTDPFLGIQRRFQFFNRGRWALGFRHDVPRWRINYGAEWNNRFDGNLMRTDIDDIEWRSGDPMITLFLEYVDARGLTYRFDARNANSGSQCRERHRFDGRISAAILEEIEINCNTSGRVVSLKINGTF